ncbi:MAG TPA: oligosaccharide flippase family protein [Kofleriaceae bacterium]
MLSERRKHLLNVVAGQANMAIFTGGSLVVTPAVIAALTDTRYGGWLLINSFIGYLRMLDLGTSAGTVKYGAGAHARGDHADVRRVLDTSTAMFLGIAGLAAVATLILALVLPIAFPTMLANERMTIAILGSAAVLDLAFRPFSAALRMRSFYFVHDSMETICYCVFKLGLVLYFAYSKELDYRILALLTLGEYSTRIVLVVISSWFVAPYARRLNPFHAQRAMVKKLATMGAAVSVIMVSDIVRFQLDATVIGAFMPESPVSISIFGIGTRLLAIAYAAIGVIGNVLAPRFSEMAETGDREGMIGLLKRQSLAQGMVASFVLVTTAILGPHFLRLWLHEPWIDDSVKILLILLPSYYIALLATPGQALLFGSGKLRGLVILNIAEALVNLVLSIALVHSLGIFGVAIGTAIPLAVFRGVVFPWLMSRDFGFSIGSYWRMHLPALSVGAALAALVGGVAWLPIDTWPRLVGAGLGILAVFLGLVLAFVPDGRTWIVARIRRRAAATAETP